MGLLTKYRQAVSTVQLVLLVAVLVAGGYLGVQLMRARLEADLYRDRLKDLAKDYESLRTRYNQAVEQAAVTELRVADGRLTVLVRTNEALLRAIETPYDPANEIHVDFVVRNGRLFIRRLYDGRTAPQDGLLIDPKLSSLRWDDIALSRGLSVYRGDLGPGRWIVTTTGNGALDLVPISEKTEIELHTAPEIRRFDEMVQGVRDASKSASDVDLLTGWISRSIEP